jgi:hypothetical protein
MEVMKHSAIHSIADNRDHAHGAILLTAIAPSPPRGEGWGEGPALAKNPKKTSFLKPNV